MDITFPAQVELDVTHENETIEHVLAMLTEGLNVTAEVIQAHGPAGRWPFVRFTAQDYPSLEALLRCETAEGELALSVLRDLAAEKDITEGSGN